ncbi:MAG: radical SAM protein [Deltaproteobacteria bacterium]|nr:radical SAM protein [Deltaproteobacteria bacterium]
MTLDILKKEQIAMEKRFWLRTDRRCNNHCLFCHDSETQNGELIETDVLKREIKEAAGQGFSRLILSGGEPTIHPDIISLIEFAKKCGYKWVQIISNGRMFAYRDFTESAAKAGLNEVTISLHSHIERIADSLTDIKGSFRQTLEGIGNLKRQNLIISIDIVINRLNLNHLRDTMEFFHKKYGITEFDLLHLTPFGRALENYRMLKTDPEDEQRELRRVIRYAKENNIVVWTNRVPPNLLEDNEDYIQDPHKILDEISGRAEIFGKYLNTGILECRNSVRCRDCFVSDFCEFLIEVRNIYLKKRVARIDISEKCDEKLLTTIFDHVAFNASVRISDKIIDMLKDEITDSRKRIILKTEELKNIEKIIRIYPVEAVISENPEILKIKSGKIILILTKNNIKTVKPAKRLELFYPNSTNMKIEFLSIPDIDEVKNISDRSGLRIANLPKCITGSYYRDNPYYFRAEFINENGFDLNEIAGDFLLNRNYHKSLRCSECIINSQCKGMHINHLRRFGFRILKPVRG